MRAPAFTLCMALFASAALGMVACRSRSFNTNETQPDAQTADAMESAAAAAEAAPRTAAVGTAAVGTDAVETATVGAAPSAENARRAAALGALPLFRVRRASARGADDAQVPSGPWNLSPFDAAEEVPDRGTTRELVVRYPPRARLRTDVAFDAAVRAALAALDSGKELRGRLATFPRAGSFATPEAAAPREEPLLIPLITIAGTATLPGVRALPEFDAALSGVSGAPPEGQAVFLLRAHAEWWPYVEAFADLPASVRHEVLTKDELVKVLHVEAARAAARLSGNSWSGFARRNDALLTRLGCRMPTSCASLFERYLQESASGVAFPYVWKKKSAGDMAALGRALGLVKANARPNVDVELWDDVRAHFEADPARVRGALRLLEVTRRIRAALASGVRGT